MGLCQWPGRRNQQPAWAARAEGLSPLPPPIAPTPSETTGRETGIKKKGGMDPTAPPYSRLILCQSIQARILTCHRHEHGMLVAFYVIRIIKRCTLTLLARVLIGMADS